MRYLRISILVLLAGCSKSTNHVDLQPASAFDGVWTDGSEPNAAFTIQGDTLVETEHQNKARFFKKGDSLMIYYPDDTITAWMYKLHADTLVYEYGGNKTVYHRFSKQVLLPEI